MTFVQAAVTLVEEVNLRLKLGKQASQEHGHPS
jgi:hypothetical protein